MGKKEELECKGCHRKRVKHFALGLCKNCYNGWHRQKGKHDLAVSKGVETPGFRNPFCYHCGERPATFSKEKGMYQCASCERRDF